ncbi:uncharacterized protein F5147DRAFT_662386 [Suillus discolor]|uniref:Secreted protein n=1 Tax=Suillus discolor TaxID=1912936 RepID=A0A9P7FMK8_9AGAM|nr:uncharacterized protein F5147DRAFT_662386 [Suillus discolor]KAG2120538.1 hypothetical protein F5147DRAFT_662386 [Suillus discolor]
MITIVGFLATAFMSPQVVVANSSQTSSGQLLKIRCKLLTSHRRPPRLLKLRLRGAFLLPCMNCGIYYNKH